MSDHRIARHEYHLNLLPLAVAAVVVLTAIPIELHGAASRIGTFDYQDFVENLLLFVPLGVALWRRHLAAVLISAAVLSTGVETIQLWSFDRFASPYDVLSNVLGALTGAQVWRRLAPRSNANVVTLKVTRTWIAAAALAAAALVVFWNLPTRSSSLDSWDTSYPLLLGNERTGDRPWRGTITALSLLPSSFSREEVLALGDHFRTSRPTAYVATDPIVLDGGPAVDLPLEVSRTFAQEAMHDDAFTVAVQFETASLLQEGPARIVSFSNDPFHRNFDLGQEAGKIVFRIRTAVTGPNATDYWHAETLPILNTRERTSVVATYDGAIARIYVDGVLQARNNIAAGGCVLPMLCDAGAPPLWTAFGALLAIIALAFSPWRSRWQLMIVALGAGALSFAVLRLTGWGAMHLFHAHWLPLMPVVGAAIIAFAMSDRQPAADDAPAKRRAWS